MNVPLRTKHPLVRLAAWVWLFTSKGPRTASFTVAQADSSWRAEYDRSAFPLVLEQGLDLVRRRLLDETCPMDFGVLPELRAAGVTDYLVLATPLHESERLAMTFASKGADGFSDEHVEILREALPAFVLHLELHLARDLATTIARTYLGPRTGSRVVAGDIRRGEVQRLEAVVGFCDLRGFTATSASRDPEAVTALLNRWFDAIGQSVQTTGGEILKFIGDAALIVWPVGDDAAEACVRAIEAAKHLTANLPSEFRGGLALHVGEVAYGNIGAADRLDFTVIGAAVNIASRLEGLCSAFALPWLVSQKVALQAGVPLRDLGAHTLKGVAEPLRVFGPTTE
jgi:adenylate cyclase